MSKVDVLIRAAGSGAAPAPVRPRGRRGRGSRRRRGRRAGAGRARGRADRDGDRAARRLRRFHSPARSRLGARLGVTIVNAPGTVDAGYRGEIKVTLLNTDPRATVTLRRGDRIAQMVVQRVERAVFHEVAGLPGSARGNGRLRLHRRTAPRRFRRRACLPGTTSTVEKERESWFLDVAGRPTEPRKGAEANDGARRRGQPPRRLPPRRLRPRRGRGRGPWDSRAPSPRCSALDFGSIQVPVVEGLGFQVNSRPTQVDERATPEAPVAILVRRGERHAAPGLRGAEAQRDLGRGAPRDRRGTSRRRRRARPRRATGRSARAARDGPGR